MICSFKKNTTTITKHEADGTRTETKTIAFGECEKYNCPMYNGLLEKCNLMRGSKD